MDKGQRGEGKLGVIIFIVVIAAIIFAAVKIVPPRVNAYDLKDYIKDLCVKAPYEREMTPEKLKKQILEKARELQLPLDEKDITVKASSDQASVDLILTVPIDLKVYTYVMKVDCSSSSKGM